MELWDYIVLCVAKADDVPVWTSSSDGHRLSLFFPRKVADKRQGIQVADRVTCKCLSWAIYLSAFLAKRGDVCHSCQLCVIFPPCLSSSFIPWMEVLFYFLFLAQLAGAPLSRCLNGSCECANLASSRNGKMGNRTKGLRKPSSSSSSNRHTEAWRCKCSGYPGGGWTQSLPFGLLQHTDSHPQAQHKGQGVPFFPCEWFHKHFITRVNACENRESQSCFSLTVHPCTNKSSF